VTTVQRRKDGGSPFCLLPLRFGSDPLAIQERIELQHQDWHLLPASSITPTCRVVGDGIDKLGDLLAAEVTEYLNNLRKSTVPCLNILLNGWAVSK
jgi:hypothetical protein